MIGEGGGEQIRIRSLKPAGMLLLPIHLQPGAARNELAGCHDGALKIRLMALPLEGRANRQLLAFLARCLDLPASDLALRRGRRRRAKVIAIQGLSRSQLVERLSRLLEGLPKP